jgi:hypothetical protein
MSVLSTIEGDHQEVGVEVGLERECLGKGKEIERVTISRTETVNRVGTTVDNPMTISLKVGIDQLLLSSTSSPPVGENKLIK